MILTILEEVVNGYVLKIYGVEDSGTFIYETLLEAQSHRDRIEKLREYGKLQDKVCSL